MISWDSCICESVCLCFYICFLVFKLFLPFVLFYSDIFGFILSYFVCYYSLYDFFFKWKTKVHESGLERSVEKMGGLGWRKTIIRICCVKKIYFQKKISRKLPVKNSKNIHYHKCQSSVYTWVATGAMESLSDTKNMYISNCLWSYLSELRHRIKETVSLFHCRSRSMQKTVKPEFTGTALQVAGRFGLEEHLDFTI